MMLSTIALAVTLALTAPARGAYISVPLERVAARPAAFVGQRILTTGRFEVRVRSPFTVDGWLEGQGTRLRVTGPMFDWQPVPDRVIDVWGLLRRDSATGEVYLDFFNGRPAHDPGRAPRLAPAFIPGRTVSVVGRVRQVGSAPFTHWVLTLEDRTEVDLADFPPAGREPVAGALLEVRGTVRAGAFPPARATVRVLWVHQVPGVPAPPFGG